MMWVFTSTGMLSVVAHRGQPDSLLIRARSSTHITAMFGDVKVAHTPAADYPFRTVISRNSFAKRMADYSQKIDYDNYKGSIMQNNFHDSCLKVWSVMRQYGLDEERFE